MKATLFSLLAVSLSATLFMLMVPGKDGKGTRPALRVLCALPLLCLFLYPVGTLLSGENDLTAIFPDAAESETSAYEEIFLNTVNAGGGRALEESIQKWLSAEFGISPEESEVIVSLDPSGKPASVFVRLSGSALTQNPRKIKAALAKNLTCALEVR